MGGRIDIRVRVSRLLVDNQQSLINDCVSTRAGADAEINKVNIHPRIRPRLITYHLSIIAIAIKYCFNVVPRKCVLIYPNTEALT